MPYYRRRTNAIVYRRKYNRYPQSEAQRQYKQVLYNPFTPYVSTPKVPDGREFLSAGVRLQVVKEIICSQEKPSYIAVFPGLHSGVFFITPTADPATNLHKDPPYGLMPYARHGPITEMSGTEVGIAANDDGNAVPGVVTAKRWDYKPDGKIAKWRLVSQGVKMSLLNNSDENEGWYEMIRYQMYPNYGEGGNFRLHLVGTDQAAIGPFTTDGDATNILSTVPGIQNLESTNFCEHPTYQSGKLRHLNRTIWKLMANTADHDFMTLPDNITTKSNPPLLDTTFDCMIFRINARMAPPATPPAAQPTIIPTKLLIHVVSNQEIVYDESCTLSRYHSRNKGHGRGDTGMRDK